MPEKIANAGELKTLLESTGGLVVIDFFAEWCGPCKMIAPEFVKLANQETSVKFAKVDVDEAEDIAASYEIEAMPTFLFIKGGQVLEKFEGANINKISELVNKHK